MFFDKFRTILYLSTRFLTCLRGGKSNSLSFPAGLIQNMEVTDQADYKKLIGDFLIQLKVRNQTLVIILSDEIIFQKQVSSSDLSAEEEKFFDEVPFDPENLDRFEYKGKSAYLFASNRQLYQPIVESAKLLNS